MNNKHMNIDWQTELRRWGGLPKTPTECGGLFCPIEITQSHQGYLLFSHKVLQVPWGLSDSCRVACRRFRTAWLDWALLCLIWTRWLTSELLQLW